MSMQQVTNNYVETRPNRDGQMRAFVVGTRVRVQDLVSDHERHGLSPEQIAREYPHLTLAQVYAALAYYHDHRDEVREAMKADDEFIQKAEAEQARARRSDTGKDAHDDSLPS